MRIFASAARVLLTKSWYSGVSVPQRQASWLAPCRSEYVPSLPAVKADPPRQHGTMRTPALSGIKGSNFRAICSAW